MRWLSGILAGASLLMLVAVMGAGMMASDVRADAKGPINTLESKGNVAIKGFDPVAYFTVGKPTKGSAEHSVEYKGATWHFASADNKAAFEADPAKYEPAYGGYCAYGVAQGYLVKIEGNAWAIRDGRLYLNYDQGVQKTWAKAPENYINTANAKWTNLAPK